MNFRPVLVLAGVLLAGVDVAAKELPARLASQVRVAVAGTNSRALATLVRANPDTVVEIALLAGTTSPGNLLSLLVTIVNAAPAATARVTAAFVAKWPAQAAAITATAVTAAPDQAAAVRAAVAKVMPVQAPAPPAATGAA